MRIALISPNIVSQKGDVAGTGIPYVPISLVYLASFLKQKKHSIQFIDTFSEKIFQTRTKGNYIYQGITPIETLKKIKPKTELIVLYAGQVYAHNSLLEILEQMKTLNIPIVVVENTQAVTSYSLQHQYKDFLDKGADYVLAGEAEPRILDFILYLKNKKKIQEVDGLIYKRKNKFVVNPKIVFQDPDNLPFPDWDLCKIENYWKLGYAHAPQTEKSIYPFLPLEDVL